MTKTIKLIISNDTLSEYEKHYFSLHPRATKKPIPYPFHESINKWMIMKRPMMNSLKQKWKDLVVWFVNNQGYANLRINKCEIIQTIYYPTNRRHDIDNTVPKFILDGLVDSRMIVDDDSKHITRLTLQCDVDKNNPRTEILIIITDDEELKEKIYDPQRFKKYRYYRSR